MPGIAIVGPHRSGTSAVASVVHTLGAYMGKNLLPPSPTNPKGYFEDGRVVALHNEMMGGNWFVPAMSMNDSLMDRQRELLKEFVAHDLWAIKDPRLCYCLPALMHNADDVVDIITVYRDPWCSARSLSSRDGMPLEIALDITLAHTRMMLNHSRALGAICVRYVDLLTDTRLTVLKIATFIGLDEVDNAVLHNAVEAVDPRLAHWEAKDAQKIIKATLA